MPFSSYSAPAEIIVPAIGGGGGGGGVPVPVPVPVPYVVAFTVRPLLGGFAVMLSPEIAGWQTAYNAHEVWIRYVPTSGAIEPETRFVYEPEPGQSLRLQKTVLFLPKNVSYNVSFYFLNEVDVKVYESPSIEVKTLSRIN